MAFTPKQYYFKDIYPEIIFECMDLLAQNKTVVLFTMGVEAKVVYKYFVSKYLNIEFDRLYKDLKNEDLYRALQFIINLNTVYKDKLFIFDEKCYSLDQIKNILKSLSLNNIKPDLVVFDELLYIDFFGKTQVLFDKLDTLQNEFKTRFVGYQMLMLWECALSM